MEEKALINMTGISNSFFDKIAPLINEFELTWIKMLTLRSNGVKETDPSIRELNNILIRLSEEAKQILAE